MKLKLYDYIPYFVIDLLLTIAVLSELYYENYSYIWANVPIFLLGIYSVSKKFDRELKREKPFN